MPRYAVVGLIVLAMDLVGYVIAAAVLTGNRAESMDMSNCDDIAIIGGGVSGSYAAWRLRERNLKISLFEYSNRIGGRCFTVQLPGIPDVNVEMGAMRFLPAEQPLANKTAHELGLDVVDFELGTGSTEKTLYYLRGKHMTYSELPTKAPHDIPEEHRIDFGTLNRHVFNNFTTSSQGGKVTKSLDGVDLYMQSRDVYNNKYLDTETAQYLKDAANFISGHGDDIAAGTSLPVTDPSTSSSPKVVKTVKQGYQAIPEALVKQFLVTSYRHSSHRNHHLKCIKKHAGGNYMLTFQPTETKVGVTADKKSASTIKTCAKKVILAIPRVALEHLDWEGLREERVQDFIKHAVVERHAGKIYFGYDSAWWRNLEKATSYAVSMTPLRQTYDWGVSNTTNRAVLNTGYPDVGTRLWREVLGSGELVQGVGDNSIAMTNTSVYLARKFYAEIFNLTLADVPEPRSAVMSVWDQYPIGASWYDWSPGYKREEVESVMIKPATCDDVYIVSNTFSSSGNSDWIEGAMEIVEKVLKLHFPSDLRSPLKRVYKHDYNRLPFGY